MAADTKPAVIAAILGSEKPQPRSNFSNDVADERNTKHETVSSMEIDSASKEKKELDSWVRVISIRPVHVAHSDSFIIEGSNAGLG